MSRKNNPHWGTTLDEFLAQEEIPGATMAETVIGTLAWQLTLEMRRKRLTKTALAKRMQTSPAQLDCVLLAKGNVTIETLQRAAALVGRELRLELI
jgi:antitoxin HicB